RTRVPSGKAAALSGTMTPLWTTPSSSMTHPSSSPVQGIRLIIHHFADLAGWPGLSVGECLGARRITPPGRSASKGEGQPLLALRAGEDGAIASTWGRFVNTMNLTTP